MAIRKDVRASDAERDSAASALQKYFVQGRLTLDELQERLHSVLAARTHGELDNQFNDMPAPPPAVPEPSEPVVFPARYAAVAVMIIVMAVWLVLAAWFSQRGYGHGYGYPGH